MQYSIHTHKYINHKINVQIINHIIHPIHSHQHTYYNLILSTLSIHINTYYDLILRVTHRFHVSLIDRVGQFQVNKYTVYTRYFWQRDQQNYGHVRCIYTVLVNPSCLLIVGHQYLTGSILVKTCRHLKQSCLLPCKATNASIAMRMDLSSYRRKKIILLGLARTVYVHRSWQFVVRKLTVCRKKLITRVGQNRLCTP